MSDGYGSNIIFKFDKNGKYLKHFGKEGDGLKEFGNTVLVRHDNGMVTVYGHASALRVKRGEKVRRGQEIALSGMSGSADRPKLHFEVRKDATPVNPSGYLE